MITILLFVGVAFACFVIGGVAGIAHARISRRTHAIYYVIDLYEMEALESFDNLEEAQALAKVSLSAKGHAYAVAIGEWFLND